MRGVLRFADNHRSTTQLLSQSSDLTAPVRDHEQRRSGGQLLLEVGAVSASVHVDWVPGEREVGPGHHLKVADGLRRV